MTIRVATAADTHYADLLCQWYIESAKQRGTGIAKRDPEYVREKMRQGNSVIAFVDNELAGFCYIETFESVGTDEAKLNDIVRVRLKTALPLVADEYRHNRQTGAFILVDEQTGATLAAGLVTATDPEYFTQEVPVEPAFSI